MSVAGKLRGCREGVWGQVMCERGKWWRDECGMSCQGGVRADATLRCNKLARCLTDEPSCAKCSLFTPFQWEDSGVDRCHFFTRAVRS